MLGALLQTVTRTDRQVQDGSDVVVDGEHVLVDFVNRFHALSVQDGSDVVVAGGSAFSGTQSDDSVWESM